MRRPNKEKERDSECWNRGYGRVEGRGVEEEMEGEWRKKRGGSEGKVEGRGEESEGNDA